MNTFRPWTKEEDEILREYVIKYSARFISLRLNSYTNSWVVENETIDWTEVATQIEGRTNKDCRKRWVYSCAPTISKGQWDEREDALLREGVNIYGNRYCASRFMFKF